MSDKLTPEELQEFQNYRFESNRLAAILGDLNYQKTLIDFELDIIKQNVKETVQKQRAHLRELGAKYGNVNINFEDGSLQSTDPEEPASE